MNNVTAGYIAVAILFFFIVFVIYDFIKTILPPKRGKWGGEGGGGSTGTAPDPSKSEEEQIQ